MTHLSVEAVIDKHSANIEVYRPCVAQAEVIACSYAGGNLVGSGLAVAWLIVCPGESQTCVEAWIPEAAFRLVAAERIAKIEHGIHPDITEREFLLVQPVAVSALSRNLLPCRERLVRTFLGGAPHAEPIVGDPRSDSRGEPFTYAYVQCGSKPVSEFRLFVVVSEINLGSASDIDEPVIFETIGLHFEFVCGIDDVDRCVRFH